MSRLYAGTALPIPTLPADVMRRFSAPLFFTEKYDWLLDALLGSLSIMKALT